jgi:peptide/nickel transport system permease protein
VSAGGSQAPDAAPGAGQRPAWPRGLPPRATLALLLLLATVAAPALAPHAPFDPATLDLMDAFTPPAWVEGGRPGFLLGTDGQGRDVLSAILLGARTSLLVGTAAIALALALGVAVGLAAGYGGRALDAVLMRLVDFQLGFPPILVAIVVDGVARAAWPRTGEGGLAGPVLVLAIGISGWAQFARVVRARTQVERTKDYVLAARVIGVHPVRILVAHVLPNLSGPVLVLATVGLGAAVATEATLSFLGLGLPPTQPSLGTLVRLGNDFLHSGEWWIVTFPGAALLAIVLAANVLGDAARDSLDPRAPR